MSDFLAPALLILAIFYMYFNFNLQQAERAERMFNKIVILVDRGKLTQEEYNKIKEAFKK